MHVASICFNRGDVTTPPDGRKYVNFGQLFYDEKEGRASIKLTGLRQGSFMARAKPEIVHPPLLDGDLCVWTGEFYKDSTKKVYQWVGHIHTKHESEGSDGTAYVGSFDVLPVKGGDRKEACIYVSIFHWDKREPVAPPDSDLINDKLQDAVDSEAEEDLDFLFGDNEPPKKPDPVVATGSVDDWPPKGTKVSHGGSLELPF